ncbi:MAG: hypothetical protein H2071_04700 [SAR86 cluster bacterium]|nr:hypothetical protein [SAR86 cluster bacterium]
MVEKYLIWPLRLFLYFSGLFLIIFYSTIGFLSLNDISNRLVGSFFGNAIEFEEIEVQPSFLGLEISIEDILFKDPSYEFSASEVELSFDILKSLVGKRMFFEKIYVLNGDINFLKESNTQNRLNYFVENIALDGFKTRDIELEYLDLKNLVSSNGNIGFQFSNLDLKLNSNLRGMQNLDGVGYFSNRNLSLSISSRLATIDMKGFKKITTPNLSGIIDLNFEDRFSIPNARLSSSDNGQMIITSFSYKEFFDFKFFFNANLDKTLSLLPTSVQPLVIFLDDKEFSAEKINGMGYYLSRKGKSNYSFITNIKDFTLRHNQIDFQGSIAEGDLSKGKFSLFSDLISINDSDYQNINITKLAKENFYSISVDLLEEPLKFEYLDGEAKNIFWDKNIPNDNSHILISRNKIMYSFEEVPVSFEVNENVKILDNLLQVKPTKLKSRLMELDNSYDNSFNFNLSSAEISGMNLKGIVLKEGIVSNNFENLGFENFNFLISDGYIKYGSEIIKFNGGVSFNGTKLTYSEDTFDFGALRVLTLIDLRANIFDILNLDFQKINSRDFFVDEFNGSVDFFETGFIDVKNISLAFGTSEANLQGLIKSQSSYLDSFDLDLKFESNISQNIPWYFALVGNIPAAAGAALIASILEQDDETIFSNSFNISGSLGDLEIITTQ